MTSKCDLKLDLKFASNFFHQFWTILAPKWEPKWSRKSIKNRLRHRMPPKEPPRGLRRSILDPPGLIFELFGSPRGLIFKLFGPLGQIKSAPPNGEALTKNLSRSCSSSRPSFKKKCNPGSLNPWGAAGGREAIRITVFRFVDFGRLFKK